MSGAGTDGTSSTLGSYVESAKGAAQGVVGAVTGNKVDQQQAQEHHDKADAKAELSQATAKVGSYTASSSGAVTKDDPNRSEGQWNQTVGSGKETLGNLIGSENLKQQGREQNEEGKAQEAKGQLSDLGGGIANRVTGTVGAAVAGVTGNKSAQEAYQDQHDVGKTQQRGAEVDIQKQNPPSSS